MIYESTNAWHSLILRVVLVCAFVAITGCASPPSVVPLMAQVQNVLADENRLLAEDYERQQQWIDQQRQTIAAAFDADMIAREQLDIDWIRHHVAAYVAAREALSDHTTKLQQEFTVRQSNLADAALAQQKAIELIQRQDDLLERVPDLRRWMVQNLSN